MTPAQGVPARLTRVLIAGLAAGTALFLFIEPGNLYDEPEHLHAAWLMAVGHQRPIHDFFEHHTPLFWHVLGLFYRAGISGPEVLYFARLLVLACAAGWAVSLFVLVRRWSPPGPAPAASGFAFSVFILTILFAQSLVVARPETLGLLLLGAALLLWTHPSRSALAAAGCGVAFTLACCASPRFVLFAPALLLADADGRPALPLPWARLAAGLFAGAATAAVFVVASCPWQELLYIMRFSSLLQNVGLTPARDLTYLAACAVVTALVPGALWATSAAPRKPLLAWVAHGALVWMICFVTAGKHPNAQAYAPGIFWLGLFAAWLEAQPPLPAAAEVRSSLLALTVSGALAACTILLANASRDYDNAASTTVTRRMLLDKLAPGSRVFMLPLQHPITIGDASYWGSILLDDSPGEICAAAELYHARYPAAPIQLPPCDFIRDLRRAPAAVSRLIPITAPVEQYAALKAQLEAHYETGDALDYAPARTFAANVLFRKQ